MDQALKCVFGNILFLFVMGSTLYILH